MRYYKFNTQEDAELFQAAIHERAEELREGGLPEPNSTRYANPFEDADGNWVVPVDMGGMPTEKYRQDDSARQKVRAIARKRAEEQKRPDPRKDLNIPEPSTIRVREEANESRIRGESIRRNP